MKTLREMTVFVVGLGQIGGSLGLDLVQRGVVKEVIGYDKSRKIVAEAKERRAIHRAVGKLETGISEADIVVLATPIRTIIEQIPRIAGVVRPETIHLDVASTKKEIMKAVKKVRPALKYISGHPIAGNEQSGIAAASADKFKGNTFVLVPNDHVGDEELATVEQLVTALGAVPARMSADQHDKLLAQTSHLPYALALTLTHLVGKTGETDPAAWQVIGGSFRSATRVAKSSPELTANMLLSNRRELSKAIDTLVGELRHLQRILASKDESSLETYATQAKRIIDGLPR